MTPPYSAREDFEKPLERINARVDEAIAGLGAYSTSPTWDRAVRAVLAISRAPKHLIRAQLVLLGGLAGGSSVNNPALERFAVGVELLHLFLLVHDDVMDDATLRRGQPTPRVALQSADGALGRPRARDLAIVMGNLLHVLAVRHLMPSGSPASPGEAAACELMLDALCRAGAGQFQDLLGFRGIEDDGGALRRELIDKSAHHSFAAPLAAGLRLANPSADLAPALAWGQRMGLAFQALDDLMDLVASPALTGKDGLRDVLEGRPSVPLFLLRQRVEGDDRAFLESIIGAGSIEPGERALLDELLARGRVADSCAEWIHAEIAAATREREAAGFAAAAQEGLRAVEQRLADSLVEVLELAAREHDG
ncbi:polyprenyl synthetase family protein [Myxococcaceae bacterium GXIMD 01537]